MIIILIVHKLFKSALTSQTIAGTAKNTKQATRYVALTATWKLRAYRNLGESLYLCLTNLNFAQPSLQSCTMCLKYEMIGWLFRQFYIMKSFHVSQWSAVNSARVKSAKLARLHLHFSAEKLAWLGQKINVLGQAGLQKDLVRMIWSSQAKKNGPRPSHVIQACTQVWLLFRL